MTLTMTSKKNYLAITVGLLMLTACGSGSSGNGPDPIPAPAPSPSPAPTPSPSPAPTPTPTSCGASASDQCVTVTVEGLSRDVLHYEGLESGEGAPLIIALHGAPGSTDKVMSMMGVRQLADKLNAHAVAPVGKGFWGWTSSVSGDGPSRDTKLMQTIIDQMQMDHSIDPTKVYVIGFSAGGFMAYQLACEQPDLYASMFAFSGQLRGDISKCSANGNTGFHHVHGIWDGEVPMAGRPDQSIHTMEASIAKIAELNGCATATERSESFSLGEAAESTTVSYTGCTSSTSYTEVKSTLHEISYDHDLLHDFIINRL